MMSRSAVFVLVACFLMSWSALAGDGEKKASASKDAKSSKSCCSHGAQAKAEVSGKTTDQPAVIQGGTLNIDEQPVDDGVHASVEAKKTESTTHKHAAGKGCDDKGDMACCEKKEKAESTSSTKKGTKK